MLTEYEKQTDRLYLSHFWYKITNEIYRHFNRKEQAIACMFVESFIKRAIKDGLPVNVMLNNLEVLDDAQLNKRQRGGIYGFSKFYWNKEKCELANAIDWPLNYNLLPAKDIAGLAENYIKYYKEKSLLDNKHGD